MIGCTVRSALAWCSETLRGIGTAWLFLPDSRTCHCTGPSCSAIRTPFLLGMGWVPWRLPGRMFEDRMPPVPTGRCRMSPRHRASGCWSLAHRNDPVCSWWGRLIPLRTKSPEDTFGFQMESGTSSLHRIIAAEQSPRGRNVLACMVPAWTGRCIRYPERTGFAGLSLEGSNSPGHTV